MQIILNLPDFLDTATFDERDWLREMAIALFQQERISIGHASRMADMEILDFLKLLAYRNAYPTAKSQGDRPDGQQRG